MAVVRPCRPEDLDALYRVCLETGDAGRDATALHDDPTLLGHIYAAPYALFEPELAFVLEDEEGVGGYVLGALDTTAFAARLEAEWWPALRVRYPLPPEGAEDTPDGGLIRMIHSHHGWDPAVLADHPSHLHIDLVARCQGRGHGARLMSTLLEALRAAGSPGVHLGVATRNERAIGFYRHLGFEELTANDWIIQFGMALSPAPRPGTLPAGGSLP
jgi:ribosomal protein S18 acetylase RimI-like enzyme